MWFLSSADFNVGFLSQTNFVLLNTVTDIISIWLHNLGCFSQESPR